jgi:hypothetical protein
VLVGRLLTCSSRCSAAGVPEWSRGGPAFHTGMQPAGAGGTPPPLEPLPVDFSRGDEPARMPDQAPSPVHHPALQVVAAFGAEASGAAGSEAYTQPVTTGHDRKDEGRERGGSAGTQVKHTRFECLLQRLNKGACIWQGSRLSLCLTAWSAPSDHVWRSATQGGAPALGGRPAAACTADAAAACPASARHCTCCTSPGGLASCSLAARRRGAAP